MCLLGENPLEPKTSCSSEGIPPIPVDRQWRIQSKTVLSMSKSDDYASGGEGPTLKTEPPGRCDEVDTRLGERASRVPVEGVFPSLLADDEVRPGAHCPAHTSTTCANHSILKVGSTRGMNIMLQKLTTFSNIHHRVSLIGYSCCSG